MGHTCHILLAAAPAASLAPAWHMWFTLGVMGISLSLLAATRLAADVVLAGGVVLLLLAGVIDSRQALVGLSNEGMITVGMLFVVGTGIVETGGVSWIVERLFGRPKSVTGAIRRLIVPTMSLSAFMNNTPLVAMLIPAVSEWAKKNRVAASKLMIPLSYAAVMGGTCTLIGTSTNLVVNGLWIKAGHPEGLAMFDITWIGFPCAIAGGLYLMTVGQRLLPDRRPAISRQDDPREYTIEMLVDSDSPLAGKTIEQAGLRHLPGAYLAEIDRDGMVLPAVAPEERLRANDRLVFVGIVESVIDLQKIRGLLPATDQVFKLGSPRATRCLTEAVVSNTCPLVGKTIREGKFRSLYQAVVIAVARNGVRINKKIGDIELEPGDTLLLESNPSFVERQRNSRDFFLVSQLEGSSPPRHDRSLIALGILLAMVVAVTVSETMGDSLRRQGIPWPKITMLKASMVAAGLMLIMRCCSVTAARRGIDWMVLVAIAASFAIGEALRLTGADVVIAGRLVGLAGGNDWLALAILYAATAVVTEFITNNAAAALMFPFALATAGNLEASPMPFVIAVMLAASNCFVTPIGYQTNLMVYGPGGYRFSDYFKIGIPLAVMMWAVSITLIPFVFPF